MQWLPHILPIPVSSVQVEDKLVLWYPPRSFLSVICRTLVRPRQTHSSSVVSHVKDGSKGYAGLCRGSMFMTKSTPIIWSSIRARWAKSRDVGRSLPLERKLLNDINPSLLATVDNKPLLWKYHHWIVADAIVQCNDGDHQIGIH